MSTAKAQDVAAEASCDRIERVDFSDDILSFRSQSLRFRNGKACTSDQGIADGCDWEHTLTADELLVPEPGETIRLVVINSNHLTGSGAYGHVFFFRCENGRLVSEFKESYLYGVTIERRSNTEFWLVSGEWLKGDAACCPSRQKAEIFRWDANVHAFGMTTRLSTKKP